MKEIKVHKLSIYSDDRYDYKRTSTVSLSEEHFAEGDIKQILGQLITNCVYNDVKFESSVDKVEIPVDEEESAQNKLKNAQKQISDHWNQRSKLNKEIEQLKAENKTLKSLCPQSHLPEDEDPEDAPNQGTTDEF